MNKSWMILALCAGAALAGCGGGDDPPSVTEAVPASASESSAGFMGYVKALVASSADTLEPVDVNGVTPPADDAAEPVAVE
ncbi:MAG: hypothetical protein V4844_21495 [Pseudomonadota bacterium]|jgi:hypothetical protein